MLKLWIIMAAVVVGGCQDLDVSEVKADTDLKSRILESDTPIEIGLAQLRDELPATSYESLLAQGVVVEKGEVSGTVELDTQFRKVLLSTVGYRTDRIGDSVVRVQRFKLNQNFVPLRLVSSSVQSILPFRIHAGAEVEFVRVFDSQSAANTATSFSLLDFPHDAESALALPVGTVVTVPVQTKLSVDVGGQFFRQAAQVGHQLNRYLKVSATGSGSSVRRGTLIGEGLFRLQVIRQPEDRVRVRILSGGEVAARAQLNLSAAQTAHYTFLPSAYIDRVRAFRRRIEQASQTVDSINELPERVRRLRQTLPNAVQGVIDTVPTRLPDAGTEGVHRLVKLTDDALVHAQNMGTHLETLDELIGQTVRKRLAQTASFWDQRIEPVLARVRRLSARMYALDQSIQLSDELSRRLRILGDYEFDLSQEEARIALERAISGRAVWRGVQHVVTGWTLDEHTFADFTLADAMSSADIQAERPRVRRLAVGASDLRVRRFGARVRGLGMKVGLEGQFQRNQVEVTDEEGVKSTWLSRVWERGVHADVFGSARKEVYASGAFTHQENADVVAGGYWFRWRKSFGKNARQPIADTLAHVLNDLGPLALSEGVANLYQGEYEGSVDADLFVVLNQHALVRLLDAEVVTPERLWTVLGKMMHRYEKPSALPFAIAPIRPPGLSNIPGASQACESVAQRLGGRYCYSFHDRIFPALSVAQTLGTPASQLDFFESFYRVPLGGAALSTRVLVRYLAELCFDLGIEDAFTIRLKIRNQLDDSVAASPGLLVGDQKSLSLSDTTVLDGLLSHEH